MASWSSRTRGADGDRRPDERGSSGGGAAARAPERIKEVHVDGLVRNWPSPDGGPSAHFPVPVPPD